MSRDKRHLTILAHVEVATSAPHQPPVFMSPTKVPVVLEAPPPKMAHPLLRHLCVVFISALSLVTLLKLTARPKEFQASLNATFEDFQGDGRRKVQRLTLKQLGPFKEGKNETVFFLGLFELTTKRGRRIESASEVFSAQLAVEHLNKLRILPGYSLRLLVNDTMVRKLLGFIVDRTWMVSVLF